MKLGIIGCGRIGSAVLERVLEEGWEIIAIARTSGIYALEGRKIDELNNWLEHFKKADIVCLCIDTSDKGETAYGYIKPLIEEGNSVVTCEKGALGNFFPELEPWLDKIGYRATVGGKTAMAYELRQKITTKTRQIFAVLNATLNYNFDGMGKGRLPEETTEESKGLGYAEPGAGGPLEVFNKEVTLDCPMKIATLFNAGLGNRFAPFIRARDLPVKPIDQDDLQRLIQEAHNRRYIVSISREDIKEDVIAGFKYTIGDWIISAGFKKKDESLLFRWLNPTGVDNALVIDEGREGKIGLIGPGAGPIPTRSSIMRDIEDFKGAL